MKKLIFLLWLVGHQALAQQVQGEIELAGFVLGQEKKTVHHQLGRPFQRALQEDGWVYEFHAIKPDTSVYAVFKYNPIDSTSIYAIEIAGDPFDALHPFRGLKLGSPKAKVNQVLGTPDKIETIDDPPVSTQYYSHKNYSVDIDDKGLLYGIQIFGSILEKKPTADPSIAGFKNAVLTKNIDSLIMWLSPDLEIHKNGKVITYTKGARAELNDRSSEITRALLGDSESVWFAFAKEYADGTSESRLHPALNQMLAVDKFFDSNTLSEIVFRPHAGKWKIFEIKFR
jgi:hypothetical protein